MFSLPLPDLLLIFSYRLYKPLFEIFIYPIALNFRNDLSKVIIHPIFSSVFYDLLYQTP